MKLKLTILLLFVVFGLHAQKELQPYTFSLSEKEKTETIMIYASAESINSITFTLKNEKNETLKTKKDNSEEVDITFKVFPFTENSFRTHLVEAINSIEEKDEANKEYNIFKTTLAPLKQTEEDDKASADDDSKEQLASLLSNRKKTVQRVRNIFQFFDALAITAFQYDTEPVAGILKYEQSVIIRKNNINGIDTKDYFKKVTKHVTNLIIKAKDSKENFLQNLNQEGTTKNYLDGDPFLAFLTNKIEVKADDNDYIYKRYYSKNLENEINCLKNQFPESEKLTEIIQLRAKLNLSTLDKCHEAPYPNTSSETTSSESTTSGTNKSNTTTTETIEDTYLSKLFDYYQSLKRINTSSKTKSIFEIHVSNKLKEWYATYKFGEFMKGELANNYFKEKYRKNLCEKIESAYSKLIDDSNKKIANLKKETSKYEKTKDSLTQQLLLNDVDIKNALVSKNQNLIDSYLTPKQTKLQELLVENKTNITNGEATVKEMGSRIKAYEISRIKFADKAKGFQNDINFLIAQRSNQIVDIPFWKFDVENIEIDFNDGFIEHITVTGKAVHPEIDKIAILNSIKAKHEVFYTDVNLDDAFKGFYQEPYIKDIFKDTMKKEYKFDNEFPIGFSSKTDFADLKGYTLYAFEGFEKVFSLPLNNVISLYIQRHQNDRLDFSPKDQVLTLPLDDPDKNHQVELKKEKSSKILNAKIFTDFNGLKESEPNGLVQIEIEKQIPLWTKRMPLGLGRSSNYGFANYAVFNLTWAKLNEEDRELQVKKAESFVNNESQIDNYITYLDLIRYENVSVGVDLNIVSFDFPLIKTRLELNGGVHYGRVKVVDDIPVADEQNPETTTRLFEKDVNMIRLYPDVILRIRPEERFGGYLRFRPFRTIVPDNEEFFSVYSAEDFLENPNRSEALKDQRWLQRYEFGAFYTPSADSDNKFFFRYRYTNTSKWETNGYSEIQLGYQIYLKF
ncbi:hypothetical protein [Psychroserpens algicola]|uniref:Uncharacterized protein n=1 Tax=Psychroserpens algicola TaxID=1719034 RepID=A0ABT0H448_9FLAO|nr:hypothetical protein [Psychroserpens algicola]MCK8479158.1 hypothetical protein [Psychroserpens algicola]